MNADEPRLTAILAYLTPRCDEEGDCLIWRLATNGAGAPVASIEGVRSRPVRRWVYEALHGPAGSRRVVPTCGNPRCVAPGCAVAVTPGAVNRLIAARGGMRTPAFRRARQEAARLVSPLTMADVRVIRRRRFQGGETLVAIAADYPISVSCLSKICRGEAWPDPQGNPFAGLMP